MPGQESENRRRHQRWRLEKDLFCYVDGRRLDARCENISEGGLFLCTRDHLALPLGATVGLVLRQEAGYGHPVFLFGRVARKQSGETPGVGLQWEKAVTDGAAQQLSDFLKKMFRMPEVDIRKEPGELPGTQRSVYRFPFQSMNPVVPVQYRKRPEGEAPPVNRLDDAAPMAASDLPGGSLEVPTHVFTGEALPHSGASGAISQMIARKRALSPVSLDAGLTADNMEGRGKVIRLGLDNLIVMVESIQADTSSYLSASIGIPCETGYRQIVCRCLVEGVADGRKPGERAMELRIVEIDECGSPGVLSRYVKWLHFNSLAKT